VPSGIRLRHAGWASITLAHSDGQQANASRTYVGLADTTVIGFYTLVVGDGAFEDAPERLTKGLARHPVPLMVLARLAVSASWQGKGVGAGLLKDAMRRTVEAADIAGIRAFAVHAKDEAASAFYRHFDFVPSPTDPLHLFLLVKDLRRAVGHGWGGRKGALSCAALSTGASSLSGMNALLPWWVAVPPSDQRSCAGPPR